MDGTFKGITLSTKLIIQSFEWFKKPLRRSENRFIPGRHGATVTEYGYDSIIIPMSIGLIDMTKLDEVMALLDGSGVLTFSGDPGKYRNARVLGQVDYLRLLRFKTAEVEFFIADPFRYVLNEVDQSITIFPATIVNAGTYESLPLLKLTGSGAVSLTLNGTTFTYTFPNGETYVYIDCREQTAYYSNPLDYRDGSMSGNYPKLAIGNNTLAITGAITQVIATKRTCFL